MVPFRSVASYRPWPLMRIDVLDQFGVIRESRRASHTPPEIETHANQSHREYARSGRPPAAVPYSSLPTSVDQSPSPGSPAAVSA